VARKHKCVIGIGSNIDPEVNIPAAIELMSMLTDEIIVSKLLETKPIGITLQPNFINGAVALTVIHEKDELLLLLKSIEDQLGRDRSQHPYGPRTIDLDIIIWDGEIIDNDYYRRDFLKKSVDEIYPF
jgi:2-amino-4-hydroxy-6-hydroxymethyldihydropteridine diphosphokinase